VLSYRSDGKCTIGGRVDLGESFVEQVIDVEATSFDCSKQPVTIITDCKLSEIFLLFIAAITINVFRVPAEMH
jgi:hypothetical protein